MIKDYGLVVYFLYYAYVTLTLFNDMAVFFDDNFALKFVRNVNEIADRLHSPPCNYRHTAFGYYFLEFLALETQNFQRTFLRLCPIYDYYLFFLLN